MEEGTDVRAHMNVFFDAEEVARNAPRRGRGRPRIVRTGSGGRPRKIYNTLNDVEEEASVVEEVLVAEISIKKAITGSDASEWYEAMATEIKVHN